MFDISLLTASADMNWFEAIVLSIVEGLTEFLPVSSTGHMIITEGLFHMESTPFVKAFTVIIQFGAILSVVCLYWRRFFNPPVEVGKNTSWWGRIWPFYLKLIVGVLPAVVVGLKLGDFIDENLGSVNTVAAMLIIGGVFMLYCDKLFNKGSEQTPLTYKRALMVGLYQCIAALLPGTSRSMATIVGGMQQKLTRKAAAEFSFFLAVPTMFGATCKKVYDLLKDGTGDALLQGNHLTLLLAGNVIAFLVAILAIKFFLNYVTKYGFKAFGWYRIIVGLLIFGMALCGYPLTMAD
jgi:undecaprenyl-diphosphatase